MKTKILLALFIVAAVVAGLGAVKALQIKQLIASGKSFVPPPESVSTVTAREEKWPHTLNAIGSITAVQGVTITPEVAGLVKEVAFESGAVVAKGDLLVRLDVSSEEAQLRAMEAQAELAKVNLERARKLRADNTVALSELDAAEAAFKQSQAQADTIRTTIQKKIIRAPFAGRLGLRQINLGQYLELGKPIVSLQSLDPVYAEFSLPQQELARVATGMVVHVTTDAYPDRKFDGTLTAINPDLDASTRSVRLQATLGNKDQLLRPGMFARVALVLPGEQPVLVIPATSVLSAPFGDSVYIVESRAASSNAPAGLYVRQQFIRAGRTRGDFVSVETGLKAGERVVSAGHFKLRNGMAVVENNQLVPKAEGAPRPADS